MSIRIKQLTLLVLLSLVSLSMQAQYTPSASHKPLVSDTLSLTDHLHYSSVGEELYQLTQLSLPLAVAGVATYSVGRDFQELRNQFVPTFRYHYDDYLQYLPAVTMLGLKAAGVEGRSSWGRMLTSDAFAALFLAGSVNGLKYSVRQMRPDNSARNSFPSGHTATAFMTATLLHKEYGLTRSPLYSIGAYTVATATALSRQLNNRHWLADVLTGAGIGILSAEVGYMVADLIFKERGLQRPPLSFSLDIPDRPSFIGLYMGTASLFQDITLTPSVAMHTGWGTHVGVEGAYYLSSHWGIGGRVATMSVPLTFDHNCFLASRLDLASCVTTIEASPLSTFTSSVGAYYHHPLWRRLSLEAKGLLGYAYTPSQGVTMHYRDEGGEALLSHKLVDMATTDGFSLGGGVALLCQMKSNLNLKLFAEYNVTTTPLDFTYYEPYTTTQSLLARSYRGFNYFTFGLSVSALFR